jgi:hypothetical protein
MRRRPITVDNLRGSALAVDRTPELSEASPNVAAVSPNPAPGSGRKAMIVDCEGCRMRDLACGDCVVSYLLGTTDDRLDAAERAAIDVLAESGLVPPLRLVQAAEEARPTPHGDRKVG